MDAKKKKSNAERLFSRYKTYEGPRGSAEQWARQAERVLKPSTSGGNLALLGLATLPATLDELKKVRRKAMLDAHPDRGGSEEDAAKINAAFEALSKLYANVVTQAVQLQQHGILIDPARCTGDKIRETPHHVAELKIDGERCVMYIGLDPYGQRKGTTLLSRYKTSNRYSDKTDHVPHLALEYFGLEHTVLDGEVFLENFETTASIMKRQDFDQKCFYYAFDITFYKGQDVRSQPLRERRALLERVVQEMKNPYVQAVEQFSTGFKEKFLEIVSQGGEGLVIKDLRSTYGQEWAKFKKSYDVSAVITGYRDGKDENYIGSFALSVYDEDGSLREIGYVNGSCLKSEVDQYIGKVVDVFAHEFTKNKKLRMPSLHRFRNDLNAEECTMRKLLEDFKRVRHTRERD